MLPQIAYLGCLSSNEIAMKKISLLLVAFPFFGFSLGQHMSVSGRNVLDACGNIVELKGVNYPVLDDWGFPGTSEVSAEIEKSGANSVRIQWYIDYGQVQRPAYTLTDLDTVISRIARLDMIPILELHDYTCQAGMGQLSANLVPWLTSAPVLQLIEKHKAYLIVNFANEFGFVRFSGNQQQAELDFKEAYKDAITAMRDADVHVPLMIDGPDCGTTLSTLVNIGQELLQHDPDGNLIFAAHTYWYGYTGNDSAAMRTELQAAYASNLPIILGEVATQQDDQTACQYNLNWRAVLRMAEELDMGWLIWAWYKDQCPNREMTTNGNYTTLTAFGNEIVNDPVFGFAQTSARSPYLLLNGNCVFGVSEAGTIAWEVFPNPTDEMLNLKSALNLSGKTYTIRNIFGQPVFAGTLLGNTVDVSRLASGMYSLQPEGMAPLNFIRK